MKRITAPPVWRLRILVDRFTIMRPVGGANNDYSLCFCVLLLVMLWPASAVHALNGVLRWNGGDTLAGTLQGADGTHVRWNSPRFPEGFYLDRRYLASIEFETDAAAGKPTEPFRLTTTWGDVLLGELVGIDADTVRMRSARHGQVSFRRKFVREIRQLRHTEVVYDGPRWLDGWTVLKAGRRVSEWTATEHGYLQTETYGAELCHALPELEFAEIHLVLTWSGKPGFQVDFSATRELVAKSPRLTIKSLGQDVIAQTSLDSTDLRPISKLDPRRKELRLRILWNHQSGEIALHDQAGRRLAHLLAAKTSTSPGFGILVKNRGEDLTIEQVRVSRWNGASVTEARKPGTAYLRLADGELVTENVMGYDSDQGLITVDAATGPRAIRIEEFAVAEFTSATMRDTENFHVRFHDGNQLVGDLAAIAGMEMTVNAPSATRPIHVKLDGVQEMRFLEGLVSEPDRTRFRLNFADAGHLQGQLAAADRRGTVGWLPEGSKNAVPLSSSASFTVDRTFDHTDDVLAEEFDEMIFLRDGTALAARIRSIDSDSLQCETSYTKDARIPVDQIKAVELFHGSGRVSFASSNWDFLNQTEPVQLSHDTLEVVAPVSFRDLSLEHGGRLTLDVDWDEGFVGLLTIHLGTLSRRESQGIARFTFQQDRVSARCMQKPISYRKLPPVPERRARISLQADGKTLRVWVNGELAFETPLGFKVARRGIWIQGGSAKGRLAKSSTGQTSPPGMVLSGLRVGRGAGVEHLGFIDAVQKRMLLQVPRSRKDRAPRHVLCARNGDLLRGSLLGMNDQSVEFRSRLSDVSLPRDQLAALIWLDMADAAPSEAELPRFGQRFFLHDGTVLLLSDTSLRDGSMRGNHALLGDCGFPLGALVKYQAGELAGGIPTDRFADWTLVPAPQPEFALDSSAPEIENGIDSPLLGRQLDVAMPMMDGHETRLVEHRNQVVVLDFWATWCAPCIRSLPLLQETVAKFPADKVKLIAVNRDEAEETVEAFVAAREWEFPVALDRNGTVSELFQVQSIPQTVIIGPDGRIQRIFVGAPAGLHAGIEQSILELLADPSG